MTIEFAIPGQPPIEVQIIRDAFTGSFKCVADGIEHEIRSLLDIGTHFNFALTQNYSLEVGSSRTHIIDITHSRPRWFAGFRPQRYVVKVDGQLVEEDWILAPCTTRFTAGKDSASSSGDIFDDRKNRESEREIYTRPVAADPHRASAESVSSCIRVDRAGKEADGRK